MAAIGNNILLWRAKALKRYAHYSKTQDVNFSEEFFRLALIILLIIQQRFLFNVFLTFFYFFHENAFFNVSYSWGQRFFTSMLYGRPLGAILGLRSICQLLFCTCSLETGSRLEWSG